MAGYSIKDLTLGHRQKDQEGARPLPVGPRGGRLGSQGPRLPLGRHVGTCTRAASKGHPDEWAKAAALSSLCLFASEECSGSPCAGWIQAWGAPPMCGGPLGNGGYHTDAVAIGSKMMRFKRCDRAPQLGIHQVLKGA